MQLSDLRAEVSAEGHQGGNIIREYDDGMRLRLLRPLLDRRKSLPNMAVSPLVQAMKLLGVLCSCHQLDIASHTSGRTAGVRSASVCQR